MNSRQMFIIIAVAVVLFISSISTATDITIPVLASGISTSDFPEHPETYCINYEDDPRCENVDICDDEGEITSKHLFCTGGAVSKDKGCPDGYHTNEGHDLALCYDNDLGCQSNLSNEDRTSSFEYILLIGDDSPNPYDTCADPRDLCDYDTGWLPDHTRCEEFREWRSENPPPTYN